LTRSPGSTSELPPLRSGGLFSNVNAWAADAANRQTAATTGKAAKAFFMTFTMVHETTESHRENPVFNGQKQDKGRISFAATIMPRRRLS
jgi:hypothetical protein